MQRGKRGRVAVVPRRVLSLVKAASRNGGALTASKREIAAMVGCHEKTVDRTMRMLRDEGLVEVAYKHGKNGGQLANEYRFVPKSHKQGSYSACRADHRDPMSDGDD